MSKDKNKTEEAPASAVNAHCYMADSERETLLGYLNTMDDDELGAVVSIVVELANALEKHPEYPDDVIHQTAIVAEEAGELTRASLQAVYEDGKASECRDEAIQTGAMALRFLIQR